MEEKGKAEKLGQTGGRLAIQDGNRLVAGWPIGYTGWEQIDG